MYRGTEFENTVIPLAKCEITAKLAPNRSMVRLKEGRILFEANIALSGS
jgi:hypothetical protein